MLTHMTGLLLALATFFSTMFGGLTAIRYKKSLPKIMGYTAGVILGVISFDVLPELFSLVQTHHISATIPMVALVVGFLLFHILEKTLLLHHSHETQYGKHKHPQVGILSAFALSGHSFLDGMGIGLAFQVNTTVGIAVGIAVLAHDFADGLNTVTLMLAHKNSLKRAFKMLTLDAIVPTLGFLCTLFFTLSPTQLVVYLGFFAGFLLYIGASDILPQAHDEKSSKGIIALTVCGAVFMFIVTRFIN